MHVHHDAVALLGGAEHADYGGTRFLREGAGHLRYHAIDCEVHLWRRNAVPIVEDAVAIEEGARAEDDGGGW